MYQPPPPALPLRFSQVIGLAETAAIDHAFHNLLGYGAALTQQRGQTKTALACRQQLAAEKHKAGQKARQALETPGPALHRLQQWFQVRAFDQDEKNQKLALQLERKTQQDFPVHFAACGAWLGRGLSPQAALVRAVEQLQTSTDPDGLARDLADWVWKARTVRLELLQARNHPDPDESGEAIFHNRAYRDYHVRILLGLEQPHQVGELSAIDTPLALAVSAIWNDDRDPDQPNNGEIVARLIQFAGYTYQRHPVALKLYEHLRAENTSPAGESGGPS